MASRIYFTSSDAWLLQAIGLAGEPASLRKMIAVGDYINHAIFTWEELQTGLIRLIAAGLVEVQIGQGVRLSQPFAEEYAWITRKTSALHKQGAALVSYLQALPFPEKSATQPLPFTQAEFEQAVQAYLNLNKSTP